jgi:hypothetical protein
MIMGSQSLSAQKDTASVNPKLKDLFGKMKTTNPDSSTEDVQIAGPGNGAGKTKSNNDTVIKGEGLIVIQADSKIDSLEHKHRKSKLKGYRVQVFLGSYAQCRDERAKYQKSGILFPSYQIQNAPDYAVRVGDFRNIVEAMTALKDIKRNYPGAFIIPDDIEPPKLGE